MRDEKGLYATYGVLYLLIVVAFYVFDNDLATDFSASALYHAASSGIGVAFVGLVIFTRYIWHIRFVRVLFRIRTPYIQGRWEGYIKSSFSKHEVEHPVVVEVWQTLTSIVIWYYDGNAVTRSLLADFAFEAEGGPLRLYCVYHNRPIRTDQKKLTAHTGVMDLCVLPSEDKIIGIYYNNAHERPTYGEIVIRFAQRKRLGVFRLE